MVRAAVLGPLLLVRPAFADLRMSAEEFEAFTTGKTLTYERKGLDLGTEEYLPGRRVRWATTDGNCSQGSWFPKGANICFVYQGSPDIPCWTYLREGDTIRALSLDDYPQRPYRVLVSDEPLTCTGADEGN